MSPRPLLQLYTTMREFEDLHIRHDRTRNTSKMGCCRSPGADPHLLVQTFSGRFDVAGVMALILVVAFVVMMLTSLLDHFERRFLAWNKGATDIPG